MTLNLAIAFAGLFGYFAILIVPFLVSDRSAKRHREAEALRERLRSAGK